MIDANLGVATDGCRTRLHYFEGFGGRSPGLTVVRIPMALMLELAPIGP